MILLLSSHMYVLIFNLSIYDHYMYYYLPIHQIVR
jgi:hypothetical protein